MAIRPATYLFLLLSLVSAGRCRPQSMPAADLAALPVPQTIVIGFMGGKVAADEAMRNELIISQRLRVSYPADVYFEVFENRRLEEAHQKILQQLRGSTSQEISKGLRPAMARSLTAGSGPALSEVKKPGARIILYGHSWGASAVVTLASELQRDGIPVLLTIQVDSVEKHGQNDEVIPDNVARAVNFYQPDGLLHGRAAIRAANPTRTEILGNFRYSYRDKEAPAECDGYPWFERVFIKTHIAIECDPVLWRRIEGLIRDNLGPPEESAAR